MGSDDMYTALGEAASNHEGLKLLVLFGSRARGDGHEGSDWDLGYLEDERCDVDGLLVKLVELVGSEDVDLVDLGRANGLLRFRAARDGKVLHEAEGAFQRFWWEAVGFWCDAEPILRRGYESILQELPRP